MTILFYTLPDVIEIKSIEIFIEIKSNLKKLFKNSRLKFSWDSFSECKSKCKSPNPIQNRETIPTPKKIIFIKDIPFHINSTTVFERSNETSSVFLFNFEINEPILASVHRASQVRFKFTNRLQLLP